MDVTFRFLKILHQERPSEVLQVCRLHAFRSLPKREGKKRPFCRQSSLAAKMAKNHQEFGVKAGKLIDILQSHGFTKVSAFFGVAIFSRETWTTSRRCYFFVEMAMGPNLQLLKITIQYRLVYEKNPELTRVPWPHTAKRQSRSFFLRNDYI